MGAEGTAIVDFGAFPGSSHASVDVATAGVIAASLVEAWIIPVATADHSADEHMVETIKAHGVYLSDGNIRIHAFNTSQIHEPVDRQTEKRFVTTIAAQPLIGSQARSSVGGLGTRIYGQWTVAWVWK